MCFKQKERDLQQVLMQAQENSSRTIDNARKEGELIIQESELKASQIVDYARMEVMRAKEEVTNLRAKKEALVSRLKVLLNSEVELIKALEADEEMNKRDQSQGTGRDHFQIDDVLKKL